MRVVLIGAGVLAGLAVVAVFVAVFLRRVTRHLERVG
jgi:hypothetical protein